ncbi:MAG TPA: hypothetical protein VFH90_09395 [Candidatus Limnocylindria bacterium]|nr:hypothetical protein [Candidatus Limnocylindria bacterium]
MGPLLEERPHRHTDEEVLELQPAYTATHITDDMSNELLHHVPGLDSLKEP